MDDTRKQRIAGTSEPDQEIQTNASSGAHAPRRRFSLVGILARLVLAVALVVIAALIAQSMIASQEEPAQRRAFERSFTVATTPAQFINFTPDIVSYGEVEAATTLIMRAQAPGEIIEMSPNLRPGANVTANEMLVHIDPFDYQLALDNAKIDAADAQLDLTEAQEQLDLQRRNLEFAQQQLDVAQSDLERAQALLERGTITAQELESRKLVVSQREQTLRQTQSSLALQSAAVERRAAAIERADRAVLQAERTLASTYIVAPFDGIVSESSATLGAIAGQNENLVTLYEMGKLEVRFSVPEKSFGQISGSELIGRPVTVIWDISGAPAQLVGTLSRVGAEIDSTLGSVDLYATLETKDSNLIRPGTFVTVQLPGPVYEDVLLLPETALYENDHFYIMVDERMQRVDVAIVARDGSNVIVRAEIEADSQIITTRLAQAGEGVRVALESAVTEGQGGQGGNRNGSSNGPPNGPPGPIGG